MSGLNTLEHYILHGGIHGRTFKHPNSAYTCVQDGRDFTYLVSGITVQKNHEPLENEPIIMLDVELNFGTGRRKTDLKLARHLGDLEVLTESEPTFSLAEE